MTLHAAKGLEFDTVFLPGWEEGLFPHQRALDESGKAGLEEERRLAYVGITRARKHCTISFAQNRRVHAMWQTALPSRFIDELPAEHVEVDTMSSSYGGYGVGGADSFGGSRFDEVKPFNSGYDTPGWKRAQARHAEGSAYRSTPHIIEGTLTASTQAQHRSPPATASTTRSSAPAPSPTSTATSCRSRSTRQATSGCWIHS
jgi:DNA helicase-2/ATP-dependent DNA helicase PcrA